MIHEIMKSGKIRRYHTVESNHPQTVADHSWGVAVIILEICEDPSVELLKAALYHDTSEIAMGDIPAQVKWANPNLKAILREIEKSAEEAMGTEVTLTQEEHSVLKLADMIELMFYCASQIRMGNQNYRKIFYRGVDFILTKILTSSDKNERAMEIVSALCEEVGNE